MSVAQRPDLKAPSEAARPVAARVHTGRMILTPLDPQATPDRRLLVDALINAQVIDQRLGLDDAYRLGPRFLDLVAFTGCAVRIELDTDGESAFCHLRLTPPAPQVQCRIGRNTRAPRCIQCRIRLTDWRQQLDQWRTQTHSGLWCPSCGAIHPPWGWDWKHQAGFGRAFIEIEEIFPDEASPTPPLFELLMRATGLVWRHFYVQDPIE